MPPASPAPLSTSRLDEEALYQRFKTRLLNDLRVDPIFVKLLAQTPEIMLEIEPKEFKVDATSFRGRVLQALVRGVFDTPVRQADVQRDLERTGASVNSGSLNRELNAMKVDGLLVSDPAGGWQKAPGLKISTHKVST